MTMLLDHVRATGALAPEAIEAAVQRQRIYGGSFDTALLELELVEPAALDAWLVAATGLQAAPHALLKPGPTRPWESVPADVLGSGWVMPLAIERGRPQLVVHPEIPDTQLTGLRRAVPTADVYVTAECCLARIASERSAAVVPQRYAVLSVAYVQSLRRASPETKPHPAASPAAPAVAPWLTTLTSGLPSGSPQAGSTPATPSPQATREPDAPTPRGAPAPATAQVPVAPPLVFNPPAAQPDSQAAREHTGPRLQAPPIRSTPPLGQPATPAAPLRFAPPPAVGGTSSGVTTKPGETRPPLAIPVANTMTGFANDARTHAATPVIIADVPSQVVFVAPLRERIDLPRRELAMASDRDAITDTLLRCAAEFSRRCALFGVKREGLRGLEGPEGSIAVEDLVVPIDDALERALSGTTQLLTSRHPGLANAVKQARDVPCIFEPVRVLGRSVLALYVDRDGSGFSDDDRTLARDLCALASERLEVVLRKLREQANAPATAPAPTASNPSAPPALTGSGAPSPATPAPATSAPPTMTLPSMVQAPVTHTPTIPEGIRSPLAPAAAATPSLATGASQPAGGPPAATTGSTPPGASTPSPPPQIGLTGMTGSMGSMGSMGSSASEGAARGTGPASALPTLIKPASTRSSTLLGTSPAPSFSPPPRGTTLPPVSGTIQPPATPSAPVVVPTQPTVRVTTSPSMPIPPGVAGAPAPSTPSAVEANAQPQATLGSTERQVARGTGQDAAGAPASRAMAVTPAAPTEAAPPPVSASPTLDLNAPSTMRTLDGELPPVRVGGLPTPARPASGELVGGSGSVEATTTTGDPPRPVLTILASPPPPAPPPVPSFGSAPSSPGTLPPITVPPVRVGGAADPRRPDRIIDLGTPISAKSRSVVTLDAEDRQSSPPSDSMVARVDDALARIARGEQRSDALLAFGDVGLQRIAQRFPGDLDVLRRDIDVLPPPSAHGPLLRTCIDLGPRITPLLLERFDHGNAAIRFYAAFIFQELRDPQCMPRLGAACFDADADVRTIAARVLETYSRSPGYEDAIAIVRRELANADVQRQLHATRACGTLRDIWAVPQLIDLLAHRERPMQEAALEALCTITGQQLGLKAPRWKTWYAEQGRRHRVEWLVATLEHKDVAVRRWGYDELRRITGQNIPYTPTGEPREREAGVRRWLEWWSRDGRAAMTQHGRS